MSIALITVLLFIFVLPVLIASRAYNAAELSYKYTKTSVLEEVIKSAFSAFIFHLITIKFISIFGFHIDYKFLKSLILSEPNLNLSILETDAWKIISYFITLFLISFTCFFLSRGIIRFFKIDRRFGYFRYDNFWYYLLTGEVLQIEEYGGKITKEIDNILRYVDVLTTGHDGDVLYSGILVEYQLAENDSLEFIVLATPKRQVIKEDKTKEKQREIPSKYFIIQNKDILNFNIQYKIISDPAVVVLETAPIALPIGKKITQSLVAKAKKIFKKKM